MNRERSIVALALLALAVAGLTATGAVDTLPAPAEDVEVAPSGGPNDEFASLTDDEKLALNVDRLNRGSRTRIAAVFTLTYTGSDTTEVWIEDSSEAVTFTALANSIESEANAVTLASGESVAVGLRIDTTAGVPELSEFAVNARVADANGEIPVTVGQRVPGFVEVGAPNVPPNAPVTVDVRGANNVDGSTLEELSVTTSRTTRVDLNVSTGAESGPTAPPVDVPNREGADEAAISYVNVSHETPDDAIAGASFEFTVRKETLDARGLAAENVVLYRFTEGEWSPLPTSVVGESADAVRFRADSPGLSVFAVAPAPAEDDGGSPPPLIPGGDDVPDTGEPELPPLPSDTPTATPTPTPNDTATPTPTPTVTDEPVTQTPTPTVTDEPVTPTDTPETPTATPTDTPETPTPTDAPETPTATTTDQPPAEVFGLGLGQLLIVAAVVAVLLGLGLYRTRSG